MQFLGKRIRLLTAIVLAAAMATSCGGGDGRSSSSAGNGPAYPVHVPNDPPPVREAHYSGNTQLVAVDESNTPALTSDAYGAVNTVIGFASWHPSLPSPSEPLHEVQAGPVGGRAIIEGRSYSEGGGWITVDYQNYEYRVESGDIFAYDGQIQYRFPKTRTYDEDRPRLTVYLSPLNLSGPNTNISVVGAIDVMADRYIADLVQTDNLYHYSIRTVGYSVGVNEPVEVSGRIYDSAIGYVEVHSEEPLVFQGDDPAGQPADGALLIQGAGASVGNVSFLNSSFASIGFDAAGDGLVDQAIRLDWAAENLFGAPTPSGGPQANAMLPMPASVDKPVQLEGRFSHSADGDYVHFNWNLQLAPPGATATISNARSATPSLVASAAGDYVVKLEVSNRSGSSSDAIVVHAGSEGESQPNAGMDAGADHFVSAGTLVTLDGRASSFGYSSDSNEPPSADWTLLTPSGSQAALNDSSLMRPTFTADVPGAYVGTISRKFYSNYQYHTGSARVVIGVGTSRHFDSPAVILDNTDDFLVRDIDNDGDQDIFVIESFDSLTFIENEGAGRFAAPVRLDVAYGAILADVNGDGLLDLVYPNSGGIEYRLQDDGMFGPPVVLATDSSWSCSSSTIGVAPIAGQTRNSVLLGGCGKSIAIFPPQPGGTLGSSRLTTVDYYLREIDDVADFTGDGVSDLVSYDGSVLRISPGQLDGSFGPSIAYYVDGPDLFGSFDINGDGLLDALIRSYGGSEVLYQQGDGTLGAPTSVAALPFPYPADVNGDGRMDLVGFCNHNICDRINGLAGYMFGFFLQQPDGSFADKVFYPAFGGGSYSNKVRFADIDMDGNGDLIYEANGTLQIMLGDRFDTGIQTLNVASLPASETVPDGLPTVRERFKQSEVWRGGIVFRSGGVHQLP